MQKSLAIFAKFCIILPYMLITLAIEQSSGRGSVAVLKHENVVAERSWAYTWSKMGQLFTVLPAMLKKASLEFSAIHTFAVGLGPGSFAGTRTAVTAAQAFALPAKQRVFGLSSGEALAEDVYLETNTRRIVIIGDARRKHVWFAHFEEQHSRLVMTTRSWALQPIDKLGEVLLENAVIAGPDWRRLGERLEEACPANSELIEEDRSATAGSVGVLAVRKMENGEPSEPLEPLYLHPPVFVESR